MIRALIVEDEPLAAKFLEALLGQTGRVEVVARARDATWGIALSVELVPDVVFLDIQMPGRDGIGLAAELARLARPPLVVFTTGHSDRACEAFRLEAVDYLLKPLEFDQVCAAVSRLERRLGQVALAEATSTGDHDRLPVKCPHDDVVKLLPKLEIVAMLHRDRRTWIHTATAEYPTSYTMSQLESWLGDSSFVRIARESIVNLRSIKEVIHCGDRLYQVVLADRVGSRICASRSSAATIAALLRL